MTSASPWPFLPSWHREPQTEALPVGTWNAERGAPDVRLVPALPTWALLCWWGRLPPRAHVHQVREPLAAGGKAPSRGGPASHPGPGRQNQGNMPVWLGLCKLEQRTLEDTNARSWGCSPKADSLSTLCNPEFYCPGGAQTPRPLGGPWGNLGMEGTTSALKAHGNHALGRRAAQQWLRYLVQRAEQGCYENHYSMGWTEPGRN